MVWSVVVHRSHWGQYFYREVKVINMLVDMADICCRCPSYYCPWLDDLTLEIFTKDFNLVNILGDLR